MELKTLPTMPEPVRTREIDPWQAGWRKMPEGYWLLPTGERYLFPPGAKEKLVVLEDRNGRG